MKKLETIKKIADDGIVAVIRAESKEQACKIVEAAKRGGIKVMEITMTVPGAVEIIKELNQVYQAEDVIIGAGTVLDTETARACIMAGAEFIVSPCLNVDVVKLCNRYGIPVMPGIASPQEAVAALECGAEILKVFPAGVFGPAIISALKGPLPHANFMPSGGVTVDNVQDWVKAGAVAIGTGSDLTKGAKTGDYQAIAEVAAKFVEALRIARAGVSH